MRSSGVCGEVSLGFEGLRRKPPPPGKEESAVVVSWMGGNGLSRGAPPKKDRDDPLIHPEGSPFGSIPSQ